MLNIKKTNAVFFKIFPANLKDFLNWNIGTCCCANNFNLVINPFDADLLFNLMLSKLCPLPNSLKL